jgi:hypothetical protein
MTEVFGSLVNCSFARSTADELMWGEHSGVAYMLDNNFPREFDKSGSNHNRSHLAVRFLEGEHDAAVNKHAFFFLEGVSAEVVDKGDEHITGFYTREQKREEQFSRPAIKAWCGPAGQLRDCLKANIVRSESMSWEGQWDGGPLLFLRREESLEICTEFRIDSNGRFRA